MNIFLKIIAVALLAFPVAVSAMTVVVEVDTGEESINALEATLMLPANADIHNIQNGNSALLMWVTPPTQTDNTIIFAGITPGGFAGVYPIFTIDGEFAAQDLEQMRFDSVTALRDDGSGTRVPVKTKVSLIQSKGDTIPPEDFTPVISRDPSIFDGKYFLVFATQDKGSGIKRYEVREGRFNWFRKEESPYLLSYQRLNKDIYVRAIDNAGNKRITVIEATTRRSWWERYGLFVILIMLVLGLLVYKRQWLKFMQ